MSEPGMFLSGKPQQAQCERTQSALLNASKERQRSLAELADSLGALETGARPGASSLHAR